MRNFYILLVLVCCSGLSLPISAQILTASPVNFTLDDEVTFTYNATLGNQALGNSQGTIYVHTGIIASTGSGWSNVQGTWGKAVPELAMSKLAMGQYSFTMVPRQFYGLGPDDKVSQLAFVFRNEDGSLAGKMADDADIFIAVSEPEVVITKFEQKIYKSHTLNGNVLTVKTDKGELNIQAWATGVTRVDFNSSNHKANAESYAVISTKSSVTVSVKDEAEYLLYDAPETDVYIQKTPFRLKFISKGDTLVSEEAGFYEQDEYVGARFNLTESEALYGSGSRAIPYNRRGRDLKLYNEAHYGYTKGAPVLNVSIPFLVSSKGYGIFFDNHYGGNLDAGQQNPNVMDWRFRGGPATYYILAGNNYAELLKRYTNLTGRQPLPPRWALGFIQSKYGYKDEAESREIVAKLQQDSIPLDGLVLDLYWFGVEGDMGRLDWDREKFPDPVAMVKDFEEKGVNTIIITEPFFTKNSGNWEELAEKSLLVENEKGEPFVIEDFWAGSASLIDITKPEAQAWMWKFYKQHIDEGVQGWWSDLGEPENHPAGMRHLGGKKPYQVHNIYSLLWMKSLYEGYQREYPEQRVFNLIRSGYAGMQRYASFPWSGDIERSWEGLQTQIPIMVSMSMSGVPYMHSDLGGFTGGEKQPELYARWLQFGAFGPIMRAHGSGGVPPEPVYYDEPIKTIVRDYIQLRYRLAPYLYSLAYRNTTEGLPIALPMNFFDPANKKLADINDQYFFGENMLIAPITELGKTSRSVILPEGNWVEYWSGKLHLGNRTVNVAAPLAKMPIFIKGGAIIPTIAERASLSNYNTDSLTLQYYLAGTGQSSFNLFDDNGRSTKINESEKLILSAMSQNGNLSLTINKEGAGYGDAPASRFIIWEVKGLNSSPSGVSWAGKNMTLVEAKSQLRSGNMYYHAATNTLYLAETYTSGAATVEITYTPAIYKQAATAQVIIQSPVELNKNSISLGFEAPQSGNYTLEVRDGQDRTVYIKAYQKAAAGIHNTVWDKQDSRSTKLPSGTYTVVVTSKAGKVTEKFTMK